MAKPRHLIAGNIRRTALGPGQAGTLSRIDSSLESCDFRKELRGYRLVCVDAEQASSIASSAQGLNVAGYEIPRLCRYMGRWIKHSGWYPDYKLRLYNRKAGCWKGEFVHESVKAQGEVRRLYGDLLHYTVRSASEHHQRMDRYTTLAAEEMRKNGKRASAGALMISPVAAFIRSYIFRLGVLDGTPGVAIAYFAAHYAFLKSVKLWEMGKKGRSEEQAG